MYVRKQKHEKGFTLVELMIATTVFSVVLLAVTSTVLYMTKQYQRSIYISRTQAVTADVSQAISSAIKYSGGGVSFAEVSNGGDGTTTKLRCVGSREFLYVLGRRLVPTTETITKTKTHNALITKKQVGCSPANITNSSSYSIPNAADAAKKELLGMGMRLVKLDISTTGPSSRTYVVTVRVVYGDDDLLCGDEIPGNCNSGGSALDENTIVSRRDLRCRDGAGSEFCAMSELRTLVEQRL